jgi:hypothetical protein
MFYVQLLVMLVRLLFKHTTGVSNINITNKNAGLNSEVCSQMYAISFEQDAMEKPYKINSITIRGCAVLWFKGTSSRRRWKVSQHSALRIDF